MELAWVGLLLATTTSLFTGLVGLADTSASNAERRGDFRWAAYWRHKSESLRVLGVVVTAVLALVIVAVVSI